MPTKALIVPSNRPDSIDKFLKEWDLTKFDSVIVVEDSPTKTFKIDVDYHYSWKEIDEELGDDSWIINRKDSSIKNFGILKAWQMKFDYLFLLDDDCLPEDLDFVQSHINNMENTPKWGSVIPVLSHQRGIPYYNKGMLNNVNISYGLFNNVPDLDAIHQLVQPIHNFISPDYNVILSSGQYYSISGMNLAFKRCVVPLMYFAPFPRWDDIFLGIILLKVCKHLSWHISCGKPRINHSRASNVWKNLRQESIMLENNEKFWSIIECIGLRYYTATECLSQIAGELMEYEIYKKYANALKVWIRLFG